MECTLYTWVYSFTMVMMYYTTVVRTPQFVVSWTVCNLFFSPLCIQRSTRGAVEDEVVRCSAEKQPEMPRFQSSNQMYFLMFKPWIPKNCFGFFGISLAKKSWPWAYCGGVKPPNPTFSFPKRRERVWKVVTHAPNILGTFLAPKDMKGAWTSGVGERWWG